MIYKPHNNILYFFNGVFSGCPIANPLLELMRGGSVTGKFTSGLFGSLGGKRERVQITQQISDALREAGASKKRSVTQVILVLEARPL